MRDRIFTIKEITHKENSSSRMELKSEPSGSLVILYIPYEEAENIKRNQKFVLKLAETEKAV